VEGESEEEERKRKRQKKDPRKIKQIQFHQNFDFVLGGQNGTGTVLASNDPLLPSSDLLKCLHHFATNYYSNKGQLTDTSRIARQKKRAKMVTGTGTRSGSRSTANSISGEESDGSGVDIAPTSPTIPQNPEQKGPQRPDLVKDMYKIFDGSALVALGVLVHEHIERLLRQDRDSHQELEHGDEGYEGD